MKQLKDKHIDEDIYIVGNGPSVQYLSEKNFGKGIIIALNMSIIKVEKLELSNVIYSMQKDGNKKAMTLPINSILLLHEHESKGWFPDYLPRIIFDNVKLGLRWFDFSALTCIKLSKYMGCNKIHFVCFDSINGDINNYDLITGKTRYHVNYASQIEIQKRVLKNIDHSYITPTK